MDMDTKPNKETLQFFNEILPWITNSKKEKNGITYIFKEGTPNQIRQLLTEIKGKLSFKINN